MNRRWMLDFDGVIADLQGAMVRSCNEQFQTKFTVEGLTDWNWWFRQPKQYSEYVWKTCYQDKDWLLTNVTDYVGTSIALDWLRKRGEHYVIVTARREAHREMVEAWLEEWGIALMPEPDHNGLIFVGTDPKSGYCQKLHLDTVVEDGAHNLRAMNAAKQTLFLVDRPWNQQEHVAPEITRVKGLSEAVRIGIEEEAA